MPAIATVLHVVASLDPGHGGPSRSVVGLTDALAKHDGVDVLLLIQGRESVSCVPSMVTSVRRMEAMGRSKLTHALGLPLRQALTGLGGDARPALLHSHGIWHPVNYWAARAARRWDVPLIIHTRGMLEPWALGYRAWKKRLALTLYQRRDLETAQVLVATSEMECVNLRQLGLRQPVAVIANGVESVGMPPVDLGSTGVRLGCADTTDGFAGVDAGGEGRLALFLSRVHPIKGVAELVHAWAQVAPQSWRLRIAGPDEGQHWAEVAQLVDALGLASSVEYVGPVDGEMKASLYRQADLFVLPTFSENFGLVVAEALAYGVPVITTRGAPWADLEAFGCGWWIDTGVDPLVQALREAMALSDAERQAMGARGRVYVQRYDWDRIADQTLAVYRWVLGHGERPECIHEG